MQGVHNFRDAGGLQTAGGSMRTGLLYRSGSLEQATSDDLAMLTALGIRTICDLRTERERLHAPDRLPATSRIAYNHIPIKTSQHDESGRLARIFFALSGKACRIDFGLSMEINYREYVTRFAPQFSQVLALACDSTKLPLLIHCTAGKDRTGFACMLIQSALGAPLESIMQDYLLSNNHLHAFRDEMLRKLRLFPFAAARDRFVPVLEARREYMASAFGEMQRAYGSADGYLRTGLGLTDERRAALRAALLEAA